MIDERHGVTTDFNEMLQKQRDSAFIDRIDQQMKLKTPNLVIKKEKIKTLEQ